MGDEPGENTAVGENFKIINFLSPWNKMSSIHTRANIYFEKCKMLLFIMSNPSNILLLGIGDTSTNSS